MGEEPLRIGVVGVAGIGLAHLFAAKTLDDYVLAGVCDVDEARAEKAAADFDAPVFTDAEELFRSGTLDVAVVATPPSFHVPMVRSALDAGLHVYCEKPPAPTAADCAVIARHAAESERVVQIGFQYRFRAPYRRAKELVDEGAVGRVFRANLTATNWFRPRAYFETAPWRGAWRTAGGGVLLSQAVHQLDAFLWVAGTPSRITARARRRLHDTEVEDEVSALLEFPDGSSGLLLASTADPVGTDRLEVHGEAGSVVVGDGACRRASWGSHLEGLWAETEDPFGSPEVSWEEEARSEGSPMKIEFDAICACHRDLVEGIRGGGPPVNDPEEAARAVAVANAVYLSAVRGEPVDLPVPPETYLETFEGLASGELELPRGMP